MNVYLFPLTGVTLPTGAVKPLNIFEPRYRQMLDDSLLHQVPISLVYGVPRGQEFIDEDQNFEIQHENIKYVRSIAGCGLPQLFQRQADGTSLISLEGQRKIRLKHLIPSETPYLQAEAEVLEEDFTLQDDDFFLFKSLERDFKKWINESHPHLEKHPLYRKMFRGPQEMVALFSEMMITDSYIRQLTLESDNLHEKLAILSNYRLAERRSKYDEENLSSASL